MKKKTFGLLLAAALVACALGMYAQDPVTLEDVLTASAGAAPWWKPLADGLRQLAGPVLALVVGWAVTFSENGLKALGAWMRERGKTDKTLRYLAKLEAVVADCVLAAIGAAQDEIKAAVMDGRIDADEMKKIKAAAVGGVRAHLGSKWDDICERFGLTDEGLRGWIEDKIAAKVTALGLGK